MPLPLVMAMMMAMTSPTPYSIAEARNHLTRMVREVERGKTVGLTRRGRLVAVVLSEPEYRRLGAGANGSGLRGALRAFLKQRPAGGVLTSREISAKNSARPYAVQLAQLMATDSLFQSWLVATEREGLARGLTRASNNVQSEKLIVAYKEAFKARVQAVRY